MALTPSGAISFADINTATGKSSTAAISMGGTAIRCISGTDSGAVSMDQVRNKNVMGGTITSGTRSLSGKGGSTTIETGFALNSTPPYGTITNGNITTVFPNALGFDQLATSNSSTSSTFVNRCYFRTTDATGMTSLSLRWKVGDNNNQTMSYITTVSGGSAIIVLYSNSPLTEMVVAGDVDATRDWVMVKLT
jgi:hypothetical protein